MALKIVVLEPDPAIRDLTLLWIERWGWEGHGVATTNEAAAVLEKGAECVIVGSAETANDLERLRAACPAEARIVSVSDSSPPPGAPIDQVLVRPVSPETLRNALLGVGR